MGEVPVAEPLGQQHLDRLADELLPVPAEERLGLAVDEHDAPVPVDDDHAVGGRLEQVPELFLHPAPVGDVLGGPPEPAYPAGLVDLGHALTGNPANLAARANDPVVDRDRLLAAVAGPESALD